MRTIDLTQIIAEDMPVYPGTDQPVIELGCTIAEHGFEERRITMFSHTGTHVDAPAHLIAGGKTLDQFMADRFVGKACVLDLREAGTILSAAAILPHAQKLERVDFALLWTGWDQYWGKKQYFQDFPTLTVEAAELLAGFKLKGVGMDCISPDLVASTDLPVHRVFMAKNMIIVENLTNLGEVPNGSIFSALPLKIQDGDGCPVRAVAISL